MTEHSLSLIRSGAWQPARPAVKSHPLDKMNSRRIADRLVVFRPSGAVIDNLLVKGEASMGPLADKAVIRRVMNANPDAGWAIARKSNFDVDNPKGEGFFATLPLTREGVEALCTGKLDCASPDPRLIVRAGERPAGVYFWAVYAPGTLAYAAALLFDETYDHPPYDRVPFYS